MAEFKEIKLPSGACLKIWPAPFADAKSLYQAVLEELRSVGIGAKMEVGDLYKNLLCIGFSSKKIEQPLYACFQKCTYNSGGGDLRIDGQTFEPVAAREDYVTVCMEVTKENVSPFLKSLFVVYASLLSQASVGEKSPA